MRRKHSDESDPYDWFYLAADRLKIADLVWKQEGLTPSGIELLHEAAERYLKGYLIAKGWKLLKTHDVDKLMTEAEKYDAQFGQYHLFAEELTEDFFAQHYPGEDWQTIGQNYPELRRQAGEIVSLIERSLPHYFSKN